MLPSLDLAERVGNYEVPPAALASDLVRDLQTCTLDVVILVNEVCSVEKEEARREVHNLVLIVERIRRCSRAEAIEALIEMASQRVSRFLEREKEIPALCETLALPVQSSISVDRYADAMRAWMRGNYDWERRSGRYAPESLTQADEPGYLEDLLLDAAGW
jgi:pentalenene synthase